VTCQATMQTDSVLHVRHDMIMLGFTTVERHDPKDLSTLVSAPPHRGFEHMELGSNKMAS
jgi:hypothetical protein